MSITVKELTCPKCGETKNASEWSPSKRRAGEWCRSCHSIKTAAWRAANPELVRDRQRAASQRYRDNHPEAAKLGRWVTKEAMRRLRELHRKDYEHILDLIRDELRQWDRAGE